jgi:hypothetical protein
MLRGHGQKQRRLWWNAIKALLAEDGDTAAAAARIGVARCTLYRWLADADLQESYQLPLSPNSLECAGVGPPGQGRGRPVHRC